MKTCRIRLSQPTCVYFKNMWKQQRKVISLLFRSTHQPDSCVLCAKLAHSSQVSSRPFSSFRVYSNQSRRYLYKGYVILQFFYVSVDFASKSSRPDSRRISG